MGSFDEREGGLEFRSAWEPAITQHEIMLAYVEAGFSRAEAVYITTAISIGNPGIAPSENSFAQAHGELDGG